GTLKRANTRGDEVYVVGEEPTGLRFFRLDLPTFTVASLGPGCGGVTSTVDLPGVRHAIEMASGPEGVIAVITDDPAAELWLVDAGTAGTANSLGTVDLQGDSTPTWAVWDAGNLLLARSNGRVELWRWASPSTMELAAGWQSPDGTPTSATLIGDQLFVGLEIGTDPLTGRVVQVSLHEPLQPMLMGASTFDHPIVTMARDGRLQLVATQDELISDEITELPPSVQPERVSWGHGTDSNNTGRSWATVMGADGSSGWDFAVRLFWPGEQCSTRSDLNERRVAGSDNSTPPVVVGVGLNHVPSSPYSPWTNGWRGFDSPRQPSYSLGLHRDPPTGCLTDLGVANGTHTDSLRVIFTVTAARGQADARYYYSVEGWPETGLATLTTNGPVAEIFAIETEILVLDDSLSVWATNPAHHGDQRAPVPVAGLSGVNLFGAALVANGVIAGDRVIAVGGDPTSLAVVRFAPPLQEPGDPVFTVLRDGTAEVDRLPNLAGAVIDLTAEGYLVWVLTNDNGTFRVFRYRLTEESSVPLVLEQQVELGPGEPPVAIGIRGSDDTHEEGDAVAIVRKGDGVELRGEDLGFISHTPLPGAALDIIWGSFVLLGDFGVAELGGPNASPTPSFVRSNAWNPGRAIHATTHIATPGGPTW
ncbi:MAG TPA: hypothetical protein PKL08_14805, partial [Thermoanaerobaculaceae bacterium]|nr:hypothetical protein [Thermoanaerobaculaceae bacterium]